MKRILIHCMTIMFFYFPSTFIFAADTYTLDPMHTSVVWHISHFGFSYPSGKWMASGTLVLDEAKPQNSKVNAVIQTADIITAIPELDKHLKAPLFFDVKQFPTATFVSNKIHLINKKMAKVDGILTLRGISKPVTLIVTLNKLGENPVSNKMSAGFSATAKIKRSDFGMTSYLPGLSDEVVLDIQAEATK